MDNHIYQGQLAAAKTPKSQPCQVIHNCMDARDGDLDPEEMLEDQSRRDNIWVMGGAPAEVCEWTGMKR